ncbi:MAG TPA: ComF family protein [Candidatus Moranbacteria bacterium]|nr:ComF family protein [Candidatus Moranbacteria bacterium]
MFIINYLEKLQNFILDTLFPIHCLFCQKYGDWICEECAKKISILPIQVCPYCEKAISPAGRICPSCKDKFLGKNEIGPLDALIVSAKYEKSGISRLVHCFKYNFIPDLGTPLAKIISEAIIFHNLPLPDFIIPIPLHSRRLRWRGFNQSEILAKNLSEILTPGFPLSVISNFLIRKKYTTAQMKIKNYQERQKNVKNIFGLNKDFQNQHSNHSSDNSKIRVALQDKTVLLIDDISTTGSTLFEAGRILKSAGAKKVFGAVIARQEISLKK